MNPLATPEPFSFPELVERSFAFLRNLGFQRDESTPITVQYRSDSVFLAVHHDRGGGLEVEIALHNPRDHFSLDELVAAFAPEDAHLARLQSMDPEFIEEALVRIAQFLRSWGHALLRGDKAAFERLKRSATPMRRDRTRRAQYGHVLQMADAAWLAKDWQVASELYESAMPALNATQKRRMGFLSKKLSELKWPPKSRGQDS